MVVGRRRPHYDRNYRRTTRGVTTTSHVTLGLLVVMRGRRPHVDRHHRALDHLGLVGLTLLGVGVLVLWTAEEGLSVQTPVELLSPTLALLARVYVLLIHVQTLVHHGLRALAAEVFLHRFLVQVRVFRQQTQVLCKMEGCLDFRHEHFFRNYANC